MRTTIPNNTLILIASVLFVVNAGAVADRSVGEFAPRDQQPTWSIITPKPKLTFLSDRQQLNLYQFVGNDAVNRIDPLGLWWWDGGYIEWGAGGLLGLKGGPGAASEAWSGFAEGWSKGGQGVINDFTGGLFDSKYGLFYNNFDEQWRDLGREGVRCDSSFKFGSNAGRVAEGALLAAGGAMAAESAGLIDTSVQGNNVFRIVSKPLQRGLRLDKPHHGKWYHWHYWEW